MRHGNVSFASKRVYRNRDVHACVCVWCPAPRLSGALKEFRIMNANAALRTPNKLIFPETYKYLPIWTLGLMKCAAFR